MAVNEEVDSVQISMKRSLHWSPPVYAPSFFISYGNDNQNQTFCIPSDGSNHVRSVPEMRGMFFYASCYGWLVLGSLESNHCHLFNPVTSDKIQLPPLPSDTFHLVVLSCPPTHPKCVIIFVSKKENMFIFCRVGDENWIKQTTSYEKFYSVGSSNGKIYLFSHKGFARIDIQGNLACIEPYEVQDPPWISVNPPNSCCRFYILESQGEIFQVCVLLLGSSEIVQKFSVYKLDLSKMAWEHVQYLGDRIFLLGSGSSSSSVLTATEFGTQGNCIYFFAQGKTHLYRFDMEDGTIMVTQPCTTKFLTCDGPYWVVPNCNLRVKKEKAEVIEEMQGCDSILPPELLQIIFQILNLGGIIRFRVACKAFTSMTPPARCLSLKLLFDLQLPWLISLPITTKTICHFYHPIYTDVYTMNLPQLKGASLQSAKFGWLLMSVGRDSLFFFNPVTMEYIKLPTQPCHCCRLRIMSFSSPPTSSDCVVFGFQWGVKDMVHMLSYNRVKDRWTTHHLTDLPYTFVPSSCNPVFYNGVFYCLSKDGKLGVFNPNKTSEDDMWRVYTSLSVQDVPSTSPESVLMDSNRSFIMENNGDIYSVFVGFVGSPVSVYKLDQSKEIKWLKIQTLDDKVMFLSHSTSLLIPAVLKGTENRIYFPRFKKNASVFYSLMSGKYHSFGEQESQVEWIDTCEHWNCTWFQMTT